MKKILPFLLLFFPIKALAGSQVIGGNWRGLHNSDSSLLIDDNEAQDLLNVDITDSGYGVKKRDGYSNFKTAVTSTWGVRGGYYFRDVNGVDTLIHAVNRTIYKSTTSLAYVSFITTDTAGSYYDFTDSNGVLWRATSNRNRIASYNGSAVTYYNSAPLGNQIEALATRLAISGTTSNPNRVYFSQEGTFSNFATGLNDTDPFTEDVGLPGQSITALKGACGDLLVWTKNTFSRITAKTQFDLNPTYDISTTIGTEQPNSIISDGGIVYWIGQDNHTYGYDCNVVQKMSGKLNVSNTKNTSIQSVTQTSQYDWQQGTAGTGITLTYSPGDVQFSTPTVLGDFNTGNYVSPRRWTAMASVGSASFTVVNSKLRCSGGGNARIYVPFTASTGSWNWTVNIPAASNAFGFTLSTAIPNTVLHTSKNYSFYSTNGSGNRVYRVDEDAVLKSSGTFTSMTNDTDYTFTIYRDKNGNFTWLVNSSTLTTFTDNTYKTFNYASLAFSNSSGQADYDDVNFNFNSSSFTSSAINIGIPSAFGPVDIADAPNTGTIQYTLYTDTNTSFDPNNSASYSAKQVVTNGQTPTITPKQYVRVIAAFNRGRYSYNPTLNYYTISYFNTTVPRFFGGVDKNHRLMFSVAEGTSTVNNATYVFDPRFQSWLKYGTAFDAPAKFGDSVYFGDTSNGKVYKWPSGYDNAGTGFTAYWKSKDFISGDPFAEKEYDTLSAVVKSYPGSSVDLTYTLNTSSSSTASFSTTDSDGNSMHRINYLLPGPVGTFWNIKFGNTSASSPFEVYLLRYEYNPLGWRVLP